MLTWQGGIPAGRRGGAGDEYGFSVNAGPGKTTLGATVAAAGVAGPLAQPRADVLLVAGSFTQALIGFDDTHAFLRSIIDEAPDWWRVLPFERRALVEDRTAGARLLAR